MTDVAPTRSIAQIQIDGILAGKTNDEILKEVFAAHKGAKTTKACVAWYRTHLKNDPRFAKYKKMDESEAKALVDAGFSID